MSRFITTLVSMLVLSLLILFVAFIIGYGMELGSICAVGSEGIE